MVYYYARRTTPANYISFKKTATFRNADTALASPIALDQTGVHQEFGEPIPIIKNLYFGGRNVNENICVGYNPGVLRFPEADAKSFKLWYQALGACATTGSYTHAITESDTLPFFGAHCELEHATDADSQRRDLLGLQCQRASVNWSQESPTSQSFEFLVAKAIAGSDIARPTGMDNRGAYQAGAATTTFEYNSSGIECTVLGGNITLTNHLKYQKVNDVYSTECVVLHREYDITLNVFSSGDSLFDIPKEPEDYAGAITLVQKIYKNTTSDYGQWTFDNLWMEPVHAVKISEGDYIWAAQLRLHNAGSNVGAGTVGTLAMEVKDDLTIADYEVS
ncbi:hypothetical protein [Pseudoalteromonas sp.]|uniref:hypothetical protein n=1 Tax=Pseudoalteromonas sp. TaxID=53249 RepID=UPI002618595E|nr:hypothetical protein [Pseudoalteromonas sp.]MCP4585303.1 hypothetical protein [Pseudoalteromonas sp.]